LIKNENFDIIKNMKKLTKILIPIAIIIAGLVIAGAFLFVNQGKIGGFTFGKKVLTLQQIGEKAINFINQNILTGGNTASLVSVSEAGDVYKIHIKIGTQEYDSYATKDGKYLFPEGYDLEPKPQTQAPATQSPQAPKTSCEDLKKSEKPLLETFVVSQCPYGLQMQRILNEVIKNIPSLANYIKVEYIGSIEGGKITSMHGDAEAQENLRQICLREEEPQNFWKYIDCHIQKGDVDSCLSNAGVDTQKLNACMSDNSRGLKYAKEDFDSQNKYQVTGSPTLFLNGDKVSEFDFGGRTAEAVKTLLCCGFSAQPESCSQKLTEDSAATGFSATYSQSSGSSGGSCGQ